MGASNADRKRYPYVEAWGVNLGSFEYFRSGEIEIATEDDAPPDVIYRRDFGQITQSERDDALQRDLDGTAFVVRRDGEPYRVWYRVGGIRSEDTRSRVTAMAERIKEGKPARG